MAAILAYGLSVVRYTGENEYPIRQLRVTLNAGDTLICEAVDAQRLKKTGLFVDAEIGVETSSKGTKTPKKENS